MHPISDFIRLEALVPYYMQKANAKCNDIENCIHYSWVLIIMRNRGN